MSAEQQRAFKGVWIPAEIWLSESLSIQEKILLADIDSFCSRYDDCYASNEHFAQFLQVSSRRIQMLLKSLEDKGYIERRVVYKKGTKEIEKRFLRVREGSRRNSREGHEESFAGGHEESFAGGHEESFAESNTGISNTNISNPNEYKHKGRGATRKLQFPQNCSPELAEVLVAFEEHRKKLKKPMTDYAKKLLLARLQKLARTEEEQIAILNQSIENGWQGVFQLGGTGNGRGRKSSSDMADAVKQKLRDGGLLHDGAGAESGGGHAGGSPSWFSEF